MQEFNPNDVRLVAMNLLARREYLREELSRKLSRRFGSSPDGGHIEAVLEQLEAENLLSDERYTESYIRGRSDRGYGPERIRKELRQRGANSEMFESTLNSLELDWLTLAREVRAKKFGGEPPGDFRNRAKQVRFLMYRGFGSEIAAEALSFPDQDS